MVNARGLTMILAVLATVAAAASGDDVLLKNKLLYRGAVDKDNTLRQVSDGLKRVVIRDSKIEKITPSDPYRGLERFLISQPLQVHAGAMPLYAVGVQSSPWDEKARRSFSYIGPKSSTPVKMTQAINDLGPFMVRYRGIDGFWVGQSVTRQVPREVVLGLLARVDRKLLNERLRIARFLLQAEWYAEAKAEVDSIARDFPDEKSRCLEQIKFIQDVDARQRLVDLGVIRQSRRPRELLARLRSFPTENVAPEVVSDARDQLRKEEDQAAADRRLGETLRDLEKTLTPEVETAWKGPIAEVLKDLEGAPDAVRSRLEAYSKAETGSTPDAKLALAMSGWVVGADAASPSLDDASALWKAREAARDYLRAVEDGPRGSALAALQAIDLAKTPAHPDAKIDPELLTRVVQLMAPPRHADLAVEGNPMIHRVADDPNLDKTEYMVLLPSEYNPLRAYPTIVALHDGRGPQSAIDWWANEASRRGYIVVAPEYNLPGPDRDYKYTPSEHASVELTLRDARKRYAIDSDRVYLAGSLIGGNMALDFGLAHPDLFAGVASVSGIPAKYAYTNRKHVEYVPLYLAIGDLALASREIVFDGFIKPLIADAFDATYVEYYRRGLEDLPEEAPTLLDWMDKHRRDPVPRSFEVTTARPSDARFFGVVVQELAPGRAIAPEAAEVFGKNIKPARVTFRSSAASNLLNISTVGVNRLDVWVSPRLVDFKRRLEVRINGKSFFKGLAKPEISAMLSDLWFRGDRQQTYWLKVTTGR